MDGVPVLMLRAANARQNVIVDATAQLHVLFDTVSREGTRLRRLHDLKLQRQHHPMFVLSWTLMHVIDEHSPLYGLDVDALAGLHAGFIPSISGSDEITRQSMASRHVFHHDDIRWNHQYQDLLYTDEQGEDHVDFGLLHAISPMPAPRRSRMLPACDSRTPASATMTRPVAQDQSASMPTANNSGGPPGQPHQK
jgi:inward rectifier potassium channel